MTKIILPIALLTAALAADARAGVRRVWAVNDGEKVERDDATIRPRAGNPAWDGRTFASGGRATRSSRFRSSSKPTRSGVRELSRACRR